MPKNLPAYCKVCGLHREPGVHISRRGLCETHGLQRHEESARQINARRGHYYRHWRAGFRSWIDRPDPGDPQSLAS